MEALEQVVDNAKASTIGMGCSTEVVEEHIAQMVGSQVEDDMEGFKAK